MGEDQGFFAKKRTPLSTLSFTSLLMIDTLTVKRVPGTGLYIQTIKF
jgi:hypothetical protein